MANSLFSWIDAGGTTNVLDVDVVMNHNDKRTAKPTDHVVETGAVITDHVVIQPVNVSFELVVTQTPIDAVKGFEAAPSDISFGAHALTAQSHPIKVRPSQFQPGGFLLLTSGLRSVIASAAGAIFGNSAGGLPTSMQGSKVSATNVSTRVNVLQATTEVDRVLEAHDKLIDILNGVLLVTVSFKGRLYIDYILTEVELTSAAGMFGAGRFKVQLRDFRTVTGTTVALPDPADFRALPKTNKGNKPTEVGPIQGPPEAMKSWAKKGTESNVGQAAIDAGARLFGY